jgi:uncharacterized membrane protein
MSHIQASVDVDVPVRVAYDQWTQFEEFPRFMEGVESVHQVDDTTLEWTAQIAGVEKHWRARIVEQVPDQRISWTSIDGARNDGVVTFQTLGTDKARIDLELDVEPEGALESTGDALGFVKRRATGDLGRFKKFIEDRATPTGAWRGVVRGGETTADSADATATASTEPRR